MRVSVLSLRSLPSEVPKRMNQGASVVLALAKALQKDLRSGPCHHSENAFKVIPCQSHKNSYSARKI
jgi:hypothetical protein